MAKQFLLGYDIGTSGSKGVIIDLEGNVVATGVTEHDVSIPRPAWAEQDADKLYWGEFCDVVKKMLADASLTGDDIAGVGVSGLTPDMVPVDKDGKAIRPCIIYMDRRATAECEWAEAKYGEEEIFKVSGNIADPYYAGYKAMWFARNEPENYKKTWKMLNSHGYVVLKLTGEASSEYGVSGLYAPFFDMAGMKWNEDMIEGCGLDVDKFPKSYSAFDVIGTVTAEAAALTGLAVGTPVVGGGVDATAANMSVGMVAPGDSACMYGTTHCWQVVLPEPTFDPGFINMPGIVPGTYIATAGLGTSGGVIKWFRDQFGQIEKDTAGKLGMSPFKILDLEAQFVPKGSDGLVLLPYFMGERSPIWDPKARGTFFGLSLFHTRAHLYRAILEGIGYALNHHADLLNKNGLLPERIVAVDGGASSALFRQIITDIMGIPQDYMSKVSGAPVTDAFLAGHGIGIYKDITDIKKWVSFDAHNEPDPLCHETYEKLYGVYRRLYEKTKDEMAILADM